MRKFISTVLIGLFLILGGVGFFFFKFINVPVGEASSAVIFEVPPGRSYYSVSQDLKKSDLVSNERFFYWYGRVLGYSGRIQVGEYELRQNQTPIEILNILASGKSISYPITIPEGYNIFEIANILSQRWPGRGQEFLNYVRDPKNIQRILGEKHASLEGYLFPDTYALTKYTSVATLVEMMAKRFLDEYEKIPKGQVGLSRHEVVTLASVVEKETGAPEERPIIASVFHNRLSKGMRLQSDPTIIYGQWVMTGKPLENIKKADITHPTPHNTYTVKALPVGPIANPGREAIAAVFQPASTDYLYFVSKNDGTHTFTTEYKDHNKAVQKFQLNRDARKGKSWRDLKKKNLGFLVSTSLYEVRPHI
jgi:UPF0755 protein